MLHETKYRSRKTFYENCRQIIRLKKRRACKKYRKMSADRRERRKKIEERAQKIGRARKKLEEQ